MPDARDSLAPMAASWCRQLKKQDEIAAAYEEIVQRRTFRTSWLAVADYGSPQPHLSRQAPVGPTGRRADSSQAKTWNHTGAHKINHCLGEALLAKFMGRRK